MVDVKFDKIGRKKSTTFLLFLWSLWWDLNPWPQPYQGCALPAAPHKHIEFEIVCLIIFKNISNFNNISKKIKVFNFITGKGYDF